MEINNPFAPTIRFSNGTPAPGVFITILSEDATYIRVLSPPRSSFSPPHPALTPAPYPHPLYTAINYTNKPVSQSTLH